MTVPIDGAILKSIRNERGLSQQQLADKSGVSIATIKRIESSPVEHKCQLTQAIRLSEAMHIKITDLSEDKFRQIIDVGEDIELHITRHTTGSELIIQSQKLAELLDRRHRLINGNN